ncbi:MAG: germination protein YpeB, partial [Clostridia bacterium]|nr:germination protein YpeB [Clostridia bacterium]
MKQISADKKKEIDRQLALLKERDDKEYQRRVKALKEAKKSRQKFIDKERKRIMQDVKKEEVKTQNNGLKVAVIALSVLLLFFVVSTVVFSNSANAYMNMAENAYNKAYYQLVMDMNNMETSLAKAIASNSNIAKGRSLNELSSLAMSAENNLATLPNKSEEEQNTVSKFFNQVMDYSNFLADKLYKGGTLTEEEEKNLQTLLSINTALKQSINDTFENGLENPQKIFSTGILSNKEMLNPLDDTYKEVSESSIEYP